MFLQSIINIYTSFVAECQSVLMRLTIKAHSAPFLVGKVGSELKSATHSETWLGATLIQHKQLSFNAIVTPLTSTVAYCHRYQLPQAVSQAHVNEN